MIQFTRNWLVNTSVGLILLLTGTITLAQPAVTITGNWERRSDGYVKLYRVEHSRLEEISAYRLEKDGRFGFYFAPPYEGIYLIGSGNAGSAADKYKFYLKGGDRLSFSVNDSTYILTGKNTKENQELQRWHDLLAPLEKKAVQLGGHSTYADFFPDLEAVLAKAEDYKALRTGNRLFDADFAGLRQLDLYAVAAHYIFTPRTAQPRPDQYPAFYRNISLESLATGSGLLRYPFGFRMLDNMTWIRNRLDGGTGRLELDQKMAIYENDTLKGEAVLQEAAYLKTYIGLQELTNRYGKYILTNDQAGRFKDIETRLANEAGKPGRPAINFTYPDLQGKKVSLTDFKGKVVLVDVWATWCGPCKAEIPSLKKLENEMHGKDIVFLSVSVDVEKDHQKWKDFIAKEELGGVQLFAGGWSDITRLYNIKGIPRFMVFDKEGNIVSVDAPRPSGSELKLLLESTLNK